MILSGVASARAELRDDAPVANDQNAVRHPEHLGQLARNHHDARSVLEKFHHQSVNLGLRADIDAASRFIEQKDFYFADEPFRQHDLLLVAAGKIAHELLAARRANPQFGDEFCGRFGFAATIDEMLAIQERIQDARA